MDNLARKDFPEGGPVAEETPRIFLLEDDPDLQSILSFHLQKEGYQVQSYSKAEELLRFMETNPNSLPNLIIVDINLAGHMNGYEFTDFLRSQKKTSTIPVVMLTAKGENNDVVRGLNGGADDYVPKPFEVPILLARLRACLRRAHKNPYPVSVRKEPISMCGIDIDPVSHQVLIGEESVHLTVTEFNILTALMARPNEVLRRDDLLMKIQGPTKMVLGRTIDVHIRALRSKLGRKAKHIVTVRGVGYKFVP